MSLKKFILLCCCALSVTTFCKDKILDVCIFLDPTEGGFSFTESRYDRCKIDPVLKEVGYALRDNVDVLIISSSLMRVLGFYTEDLHAWEKKPKQEAAIRAKSTEKERSCDAKVGTKIGGDTITQDDIDHLKTRQSDVENSIKLIRDKYIVCRRPGRDSSFAVLINDKSNIDKKVLDDLRASHKIGPANFSYVFKYPKNESVDHLLKILEDMLPNRKIIYLVGHGGSSEELKKTKMDPLKFKPGKEARIATLKYDEYSALIDGLGKSKPESKCIFLAITSCYAAGWNALTMHSALVDKSKEIFKKKEIQFPIALGVLTDAAAPAFDKNFKKLFETLHRIFTGVDPLIKEDSATTVAWTKKPFEKILVYLYGDELRNFPSIRFPGLDTFFRAVNVDDKVAIITYPELIRHEMQFIKRAKSYKEVEWHPGMPVTVERTRKEEIEELRKEEIEELEDIYKRMRKLRSEGRDIPQKIKDELSKKIKKIRKQMKSLVFTDKIAILIYPSVIDIPIAIKGNIKTKFISMISGPAHHYIADLSFEKHYPDTSLTKFVSPKSFFVAKVTNEEEQHAPTATAFDGEYKPYIFNENVTLPGDSKEIKSLHRDSDDDWYKEDGSGSSDMINESDALDILKKILDITTPAREALWEATGGMESERKFRIKINESLRRICNKPDSWGLYPERMIKRQKKPFKPVIHGKIVKYDRNKEGFVVRTIEGKEIFVEKSAYIKPFIHGKIVKYDRDKGSFIVLTKNGEEIFFDKKFFSFGAIKIGAKVEMTEDNGKYEIVGVSPVKKIEQQIAWKKRVGKVIEERERAFIVEISEPISIKSRFTKEKKEINKIACPRRLIKKSLDVLKKGDEVTVEISPDLLGRIVNVRRD